MTKTVADVMKLVKEKECTFVDFRFVDTREKSNTYPFRFQHSTKINLRVVMRSMVHRLLDGKELRRLTCC